MNSTIVPPYGSQIAKQHFADNLEAWKNFAQRITHNPFVKQYLFERDGNTCSWCHWVLTDHCNIHHHTYNHICTSTGTITINTSTTKRPQRTRLVPDCESCKNENNSRFLSCMEKLSLVHGGCNKKIETARQKDTALT